MVIFLRIVTPFLFCCCITLSHITFYVDTAVASPTQARWTEVPVPAQGDAGNWVLAPGSDINHLTVSSDNTLYVYANPTATGERLFRSTDNGTGWSPVGSVSRVITAIATDPTDARYIYYAAEGRVYSSANAGITFEPLPPLPFNPGAADSIITSIVALNHAENRLIAVSTTDPGSYEYGNVYVFDRTVIFSTWQVVNIGSYDVLRIAASKDFPLERRLLAVTANETDTVISTVYIGVSGVSAAPLVIPGSARSASVTFPADYSFFSVDPYLFVGLNNGDGSGDVYRISWPSGLPVSSFDLNTGFKLGMKSIDITSLCAGGSPTTPVLVAGAGGRILVSPDNGLTWSESVKPPTGHEITGLAVLNHNPDTSVLFAVTAGSESAFSISDDSGATWVQIGLIDTLIPLNNIIDLAVSPASPADQGLFLITRNVYFSLWHCPDGAGNSWRRILCSTLNSGAFSRIALSPAYGQRTRTVFLYGSISNTPCIWRSKNGGRTFTHLSTPYPVDAWAVFDDNTLAIAGYDGSKSRISLSDNGGYFYTNSAVAGEQQINSVAFSPDYPRDRTLIAGNNIGRVFMSTDNAISFKQVGQQLPLASGFGRVSIAFDPRYATNSKIYAATDVVSTTASPDRIFQLIIGKSRSWENIDKSLPAGSIITRITLSRQGVLYALNSRAVTQSPDRGGIERSLNPGEAANFETVILGLNNGNTLMGLCLSGNRLWAMDMANTRLVTYEDTIAVPVAPLSPVNLSPGVTPEGTRLDWKAVSGANTYQWQVSFNDRFSDIPGDLQGYCEGSSVRLPALEISETYYWRVRVTKPVLGPWSEHFSFSVRLGREVFAPRLLYPSPGAAGVPCSPVFQWSAVAGAAGYELQVSPDISFNELVVKRHDVSAIPDTAWQIDVPLDPGKTYYWKVKAVNPLTESAWSAASAFVVALPPQETTAPLAVTISPPPIQLTPLPPTVIVNNPPEPGFPLGIIYLLVITGVLLVALLTGILIVLLKKHIVNY